MLMNDLRFAFRQLLKSPGFSILAILTLALGIGINSAIFSLMHDLFLRGLPFHEPERVVRMYGRSEGAELEPIAVLGAALLALPRWAERLHRDRRRYWQRVHHDRTGRAGAALWRVP